MATYLFAWNPKLWDWPELERQAARAARRGFVDVEWSSGRTRQIEPGSRAFVVRLGVPPKGIIGAGHTITAPRQAPHWLPDKAAAGALTNYLYLRIERLMRMPIVTFDDFAEPPFARYRWGIRQSGAYLPESLADALEDLWEARLAAAHRGAGARKRPQSRK
jgi:5-methylcytosine-specific restriction protein A